MPIYEYKCDDCGSNYEQIRRMADADSGLECPTCQSHSIERQLSSFATTSGGMKDSAPSAGNCGMGACAGGQCAFSNN